MDQIVSVMVHFDHLVNLFIFVKTKFFDTHIGSHGSCMDIIHVKFLLDLEISTCPPFCLVNQSMCETRGGH